MNYCYLDWAATAIPDPDILKKYTEDTIVFYGNPSSLHTPGRNAEKQLIQVRKRFADLLFCCPEQIIFTSGGSEANNMILSSLYLKKRKGDIIISGIEHPSVYESVKQLKLTGFNVKILNTERNGIVEPEKLLKMINGNTLLISIMTVNNETGVIQPINEIVKTIRDAEKKTGKKIFFHTDAVQAFGKININPVLWDVDSLSLSAHKIGGPRGTGALYLKKQINFLYKGGGQEMGLKPGTENLAGICGLVYAAEKKLKILGDLNADPYFIKKTLHKGLKSIPGTIILPEKYSPDSKLYSPYITAVAIPPIPGEVLVRVMNDKGFAISTGSACSSKKKNRFRIMDNIGIKKELSFSAIRISTGSSTEINEIDSFITMLKAVAAELINK